jgi:hypothetical protein
LALHRQTEREQRPIGSSSPGPRGQFIDDAVTALGTVRALIDCLVKNGVLKGEHASAIAEAASREFLLRSTDAEAKKIAGEPEDPRERRLR